MSEIHGTYTENWKKSALGALGLSESELSALQRMSVDEIDETYRRAPRFIRAVVLFELIFHYEREKAAALFKKFDIGYEADDEELTQEQRVIIQQTQVLFRGDVTGRLPQPFSRS